MAAVQFSSLLAYLIHKYVCVSQVISGQQLPKVNQKEGSIVDPLVRVEIYGAPQDQYKEETSHINNNGKCVLSDFNYIDKSQKEIGK